MTGIGKFVGTLVVLSVLAMPAAALVSCWTPLAMSSECPLCHHNSPDGVQANPVGASCCDLSSSKPAPASVLQAPTSTTVLAAPANALIAVAVATAARVDHFSDQGSISPPASPQAVLCTFLI